MRSDGPGLLPLQFPRFYLVLLTLEHFELWHCEKYLYITSSCGAFRRPIIKVFRRVEYSSPFALFKLSLKRLNLNHHFPC